MVYTSEKEVFVYVVPFPDNSYLFAFFDYSDYTLKANFYDSTGNEVYSGLQCPSPNYTMTPDRSVCYANITYCETYNLSAGTCQQCNETSLVLSGSGLYCLNPDIKNCTTYDYSTTVN